MGLFNVFFFWLKSWSSFYFSRLLSDFFIIHWTMNSNYPPIIVKIRWHGGAVKNKASLVMHMSMNFCTNHYRGIKFQRLDIWNRSHKFKSKHCQSATARSFSNSTVLNSQLLSCIKWDKCKSLWITASAKCPKCKSRSIIYLAHFLFYWEKRQHTFGIFLRDKSYKHTPEPLCKMREG